MRTLTDAARLRDRLGAHTWAFYVGIHTAAARKDGTLIDSIRELAAGTGTGTSTVPRLLRELADRGLIEWRKLSDAEVEVHVL